MCHAAIGQAGPRNLVGHVIAKAVAGERPTEGSLHDNFTFPLAGVENFLESRMDRDPELHAARALGPGATG